jgi:hypothetical protein
VTKRAQIVSPAAHHAEHEVAGRGLLAHRSRAHRPTDAGEHRLDLLVAGRRVVAGGAVEVADGGKAAAKRASAAPGGSLVS